MSFEFIASCVWVAGAAGAAGAGGALLVGSLPGRKSACGEPQPSARQACSIHAPLLCASLGLSGPFWAFLGLSKPAWLPGSSWLPQNLGLATPI